MPMTVEKLSLLGSLEPLRHTVDNSSVKNERGFAESLDKALGNAELPESCAGDKARELAESLTLQMLHSSLNLAGDSSTDPPATSNSFFLPSTSALLQAYRENIPSGDAQKKSSFAHVSSQLQDLTDTASAPVISTANSKKAVDSHSDTDWLDPLIHKASSKYGVDVGLIKAVIKVESDFNPNAVSHAGARGLMQLMPATARSLGVNDSFNPEQNVMGGTRFLKDMLQRYNGDVDSALAAYNWGPGNVDKRPDRMPRETRDYLARVKQLYASYSS